MGGTDWQGINDPEISAIVYNYIDKLIDVDEEVSITRVVPLSIVLIGFFDSAVTMKGGSLGRSEDEEVERGWRWSRLTSSWRSRRFRNVR